MSPKRDQAALGGWGNCLGIGGVIEGCGCVLLRLTEHIRNSVFAVDLDTLEIPSHDLVHLEAPITKDEVWAVVKDHPLDKAPRLDGFTGRFYKPSWVVIKGDSMRAVDYYSRGDLRGLGRINKALIGLLPKADGDVELKDYMPVSLEHDDVKILKKILANRVAAEFPAVVGVHQSVFVRGMALPDNFMLVQGIARRLHSLLKLSCLINLDIYKSSDMVDRSFLLQVFGKWGFGSRWISRMCGLLASATTRVLVNDTSRSTLVCTRC